MTFDTRLTELIALGAAVAANCAACLEHHVGKAREIGLPAEEVEAALEVGRGVRQGAAGALDRVAARLGTAPPAAAGTAAPARAARGCCG
jgi:AhpD family alkylhydroperoxidase